MAASSISRRLVSVPAVVTWPDWIGVRSAVGTRVETAPADLAGPSSSVVARVRQASAGLRGTSSAVTYSIHAVHQPYFLDASSLYCLSEGI